MQQSPDRASSSRRVQTPPHPARALAASALALLALGAPAVWAEEAAVSAGPGIDLVREAATGQGPILTLRRTPTEFESEEPGPAIEVFADGGLRITRPSYMTRPGVWRGQADPGSVLGLLEKLRTSGFLDLEPAALRTERAARLDAGTPTSRGAAPRTLLIASGDPDLTELEIRLEHYVPRGALASAPAPLRRSWAWSDLHTDARRLPDLEPLVAFARAQDELIAWIDDEGSERTLEKNPAADRREETQP
ncbi:MAG: hypothetical protein AAF725_21870 [Acidobacteriota bacterium]